MAEKKNWSLGEPGEGASQSIQVPGSLLRMDKALAHHRAERLQEAEDLYNEILRSEPDHTDANHLLGVVASQTGRYDLAIRHISKAIEADPGRPSFHNNLGNALQEQGGLEEAAASYGRALALKPDYAEALNNLGNTRLKQKRLEEAVAAYHRALEAIPGYARAHNNLGNALLEQRKPEEALAAYRRAISLEPDYAEAHNNLGNALREEDRLDEAQAAFERAVEARPEYAEALNNLGTVIQEQGGLEDSLALHARALALKPDLADAHNNLGNTLQKLGRVEEAVPSFERALTLRPEFATAEFNLSLALLVQGDFRAGWQHYESRWDTRRLRDEKREFSQPAWDASTLAGKTILLHAEQGIGDTLQFVRYARRVAEYGGRRILECQKELVNLLAPLPDVDAVITQEDEPPAFDVHASLLSLPHILGTTLETIPREVPYIPAPEDPAPAAESLAEGGGLKVGLVWAGNPRHPNDRNRSFPLKDFAPALETEGVRFFGLQMGERRGEIAGSGLEDRVEDLGDSLTDFSATASIIARLDLLVSVDTAPAHLAGAMGKPVWTLLPFAPDWRWMLEREDSPWYPTMRLVRQKRIGDWEGPLREVKEGLERMARPAE